MMGQRKFGSEEESMKMIQEVRDHTELVRVLSDSAAAVGKKYDIEREPVVKGQAMSVYEPRSIKGTGLTYATTPQGADHTYGLIIRTQIDHLDLNAQKNASLIQD
jgi:aldehyde:ferredoxin oxidoreductase